MNHQDKPLVSVIIPLYNCEKYITETIESVLSQTYENMEIIVVDDGSTDSSAGIVKGFNDERIKYHYQENMGGALARNKGIEFSKGEYIATLDSDDLWLPYKIEAQVNEILKNPEVGQVYGWVYYINPEGEITGKTETHVEGDHYLELLLRNYITTGSVSLIKRECFDKVGYFNKEINNCQEWDLGLRIAREYKFACVKDYICKYRIHPESVSKKQSFYERIKKTGLLVLEREFSKDYPGLERIKPKVYSNRYRYLAEICRNNRNFKETVYNICKAIQTRPATLTEKRTLVLIVEIFASMILPDKAIKFLKRKSLY